MLQRRAPLVWLSEWCSVNFWLLVCPLQVWNLCMMAHVFMWAGLDFIYLAALPDLRLRLRVLYGADVADLCYS